MKYLRTFIALPLKVNNHFLLAREEMVQRLANERISWVDPGRYHVTIRFLGDTPPEELEMLRQSMRDRISVPGKTRVQLNHVGSFGPRKKPRVIWLGFEDSHFFESWRDEVDKALEDCGIMPDRQAFRAHLTLGRIRALKDLKGFYEVIESMKDRFSGEILSDRLVYYKSDLGSGGPVYTPLEELIFPDQPF